MWCVIWTESIWIYQKNLSKSGREHEVMVPSAALYYEFQGRLEELTFYSFVSEIEFRTPNKNVTFQEKKVAFSLLNIIYIPLFLRNYGFGRYSIVSSHPVDCRVHGFLQSRILEWVTFPFFRGSSQSRDRTQGLPHCRWILYQLSHKGSPSNDQICLSYI